MSWLWFEAVFLLTMYHNSNRLELFAVLNRQRNKVFTSQLRLIRMSIFSLQVDEYEKRKKASIDGNNSWFCAYLLVCWRISTSKRVKFCYKGKYKSNFLLKTSFLVSNFNWKQPKQNVGSNWLAQNCSSQFTTQFRVSKTVSIKYFLLSLYYQFSSLDSEILRPINKTLMILWNEQWL